MKTTVIRERLHEYIEHADSKQLKAIYTLLEKELEPDYKYDAATLNMLYKRRENHLQGKSKTFSGKEAIESIRATNRK